MKYSVPAGLRLIIRYKIAKASIEILVSTSFFLMGSTGSAQKLSYAAHEILHHATERWSIALAESLLDKSTAHNVFVVAMALLADGLVTMLEGFALYRGYRWGRWLVVCATGALIPFEIDGLYRHPSWSHFLFLLVNALIVLYMLRQHHAPAEPKAMEA